MKRNETIELNGIEYTLELNRESALKIEQRTNMSKAIEEINKQPFEYIEEISEDEDPFAEDLNIDRMIEQTENQEKTLKKLISVAFYIWLYPNHKLKYNEVCEILNPYFATEKDLQYISEKYGEYMKLSSEISEKYIKEAKNLKAQANK